MTPTSNKVEGTTQFEQLDYPWFKCRLTYGLSWSRIPAREAADPLGGHERISHAATLLCGVKDKEGNSLVINPTERIEVQSKQLEGGIFEITGEPDPIRKKRKLIGYSVTISKVEEHPFVKARG